MLWDLSASYKSGAFVAGMFLWFAILTPTMHGYTCSMLFQFVMNWTANEPRRISRLPMTAEENALLTFPDDWVSFWKS